MVHLSLDKTFDKRKSWDINDARAKEVHNNILLMMALDNQPFSMAEDEGFNGLMAHFQPQYAIPNRARTC